MLECIDIAGTYRIMTSKTMKTLGVQVSWGPNVRGPSVPGVQMSPRATLGPQGHLDPGHLDPKTLGLLDFWFLRS